MDLTVNILLRDDNFFWKKMSEPKMQEMVLIENFCLT